MTRPIVVMGPSGCGKSTLARLLAAALGQAFVEGDDLHPAANRERMARGQPLNDVDRAPFLEAIALALAELPAPVVSCSALKCAYRDFLRDRVPDVIFVHPEVPAGELARRVTHREGHYMPATLVADQVATLEPLEPWEGGFTIDGTLHPNTQLAFLLEQLKRLR